MLAQDVGDLGEGLPHQRGDHGAAVLELDLVVEGEEQDVAPPLLDLDLVAVLFGRQLASKVLTLDVHRPAGAAADGGGLAAPAGGAQDAADHAARDRPGGGAGGEAAIGRARFVTARKQSGEGHCRRDRPPTVTNDVSSLLTRVPRGSSLQKLPKTVPSVISTTRAMKGTTIAAMARSK